MRADRARAAITLRGMERIEFIAPLQVRWRVAEEPTPYGVGRPRVYLDTSIPSYLVGRLNTQQDIARRQRITDVWWKRYRHRFELYVSEEVKKEARCGNAALAQQRLDLLDGIDSLHRLTPIRRARVASDRKASACLTSEDQMPRHIAIAATHSIAVPAHVELQTSGESLHRTPCRTNVRIAGFSQSKDLHARSAS